MDVVLTILPAQRALPFHATPTTSVDQGSVLLPAPRLRLTIAFWPIFSGLALAAVAAAFRYGEELQRDTAGLV